VIALEQQVNLFQPIFRAEKKLFSTAVIGGSLAAMIVVLVLVWVFAWRQVISLEREVAVVESARAERQDAIRRVGAGFASDPAVIVTRARELADGVERAERTLTLIREGAIGSTTGFSPRLRALARPDEPGLWLTRIALAGRDAAFAGVAHDPAAIPRYLQALTGDEAFVALHVDSFQADRDEDGAGNIAFVAGNGNLFSDEKNKKPGSRAGAAR
jgi:hypothetical protein